MCTYMCNGDVEMCHCVILQSHCMGFIEDLFNTNKVRYTVLEEMTADILKIAKDRAAQISSILGIKSPAEVRLDSNADFLTIVLL